MWAVRSEFGPTSKQAPSAQKQSSKTTHFPLYGRRNIIKTLLNIKNWQKTYISLKSLKGTEKTKPTERPSNSIENLENDKKEEIMYEPQKGMKCKVSLQKEEK